MTAARAAVRRAEAAEREAIAALSHAESSSRTSATLAKQGVVAAKDAEHAGHQVDIRREAVQVSQSALAQARAELVRAEASAGVPATGRVRQATEVRSPAVGRVLRVRRESAGPVAAGTPLLDVGNTRLKWLRLDGARRIVDSLVTAIDNRAAWPETMDRLAARAGDGAAIASVNPPADEHLESLLIGRGVGPIRWFRSAADVPLPHRLAAPEQTGADRALSVLAA